MKTNGRSVKRIVMFAIIGMLVFEHSARACTSVCLTKDGHIVFGNNLDWFIDDGLVVINKRNVKKRGAFGDNPPQWVSKYGSITVNQSGNGFTSRGMNEAGLVIGEMALGATAYPERDARPSLNIDQWMQYELDRCASVEEVLATDRVVRIDKDEYKSHFFICDASGTCATVEWLDGKLCAHKGDAVKIKALVNSPYSECLARGDDPTGRFAKAARMLDNYAGEDPVKYVFSILRATRQRSTVWSVVFDVKNHLLHYCTARNPELRSVSLSDFDLSCSSPVQILDINAPGTGDVKAGFKDFTHEENARIACATLDKWGARYGKVSDADVEKTLNYHMTMQCMTNLSVPSDSAHPDKGSWLGPAPAETPRYFKQGEQMNMRDSDGTESYSP